MTVTSGKAEERTGRRIIDRALSSEAEPFAIVARCLRGGRRVEAFDGELRELRTIDEIPLPAAAQRGHRYDSLVLLPFRQLRERGFTCTDDGEPILLLQVARHGELGAEDLERLAELPVSFDGEGAFDTSDEEYERLVGRVLADEIGAGSGSNFVIRRTFSVQVEGDRLRFALGLFHRLLKEESGAYWTFVVHTGERIFVGATPERHVSLDGGVASMTPISGTYHYPEQGPDLEGVVEFLADRKETDELYMVVDEELKMMAGVCEDGGRVHGPWLRPMARLAHTEYEIRGTTALNPRQVLRRTMFAPTVVGSPLENACRVITRYEPAGRGYYSGAIALLGADDAGYTLDSAIMIRTGRIDPDGRMSLGVGATLVRHSAPARETAETWAKAAGLLGAAGPRRRKAVDTRGVFDHPRTRAALEARNRDLSGFWLADRQAPASEAPPPLLDRSVLVVDAEDSFTGMLAHQFRSLGARVQVVRHDLVDREAPADHGLVVVGPGPGDPCDASDSRIAGLRRLTGDLLADGRPFLSVCLGHQVLASVLGLDVCRRAVPDQGKQRRIDLFGRSATVAFYSTYVAVCPADEVAGPTGPVHVSREPTGEVHALRGPHFASMQFHPESLLTPEGPELIAESVRHLLDPVGGTRA
ncbi:phenazine biosynthesis protein PhzE [Streptomonospora arabica]